MPADPRPLAVLLRGLLPDNRFYARKYAGLNADFEARSEAEILASLPLLTKAELVADQLAHPPYGQILSYPRERYCRLHQTSGTTTGRPLRWLDTPASWDWLLSCWTEAFAPLNLQPSDVFFFPFSFGPFLGFWTSFEAASRAGFLCLAGGGMTSAVRLRFLLDNSATVVCCTPTYALHLAEEAAKAKIDLAASAVRYLIVAGEPGGGIPSTRQRIEAVWGARVIDHYGLTEVGPTATELPAVPRRLVIPETHFYAESIDPQTARPVAAGEVGELVLTNLGRLGSPLIRYRTGDLVRMQRIDGRLCLEGGIIGRADDMIAVRGNNLYPSAVEEVVRRCAEVAEFRIVVDRRGPMAEIRVEVEAVEGAKPAEVAEQIGLALRGEFPFRMDVSAVPAGTLPRFELKAKRVVVQG